MRNRLWLFCAFAVLAVLTVYGLRAQSPAAASDPFAAADEKILAEIHDHSEAAANLEYLSDIIGPRLTGSERTKKANEWTAEIFRKYGLTNVHLEPWTIAHSWTRGTAHARVVTPSAHPLTIASAGWSPSTPGVVRGPVVYFNPRSEEEFAKFKGKLKGAIIIATEPNSLSPPPSGERSPMLGPMQAPPPLPGQPAAPSPFARFQEPNRKRNEFLKEEGVAAVLRDSGKPHGLLNMTGIGGEKFNIGEIPTAFITGEGYRLLWRLQKRGPVEVELEMTNSFSDKPVEVYNTVAELRGSEKPGEVVILGAHLDSWDLGEGSTDNGTGSMVVLEAARTLARLDLKPKRTIRFVLFTGEEEGLVGSKMYVEAHQADLQTISGILVHDTGTGRVLTLGLHDNYQDREIVDHVLAPLRSLLLLEPSMRRSFGTDHASFNNVGVPGFYCIQDGAEYSKTHHSQSDTFDKVWADDLNQGAQVLAAWAYNTSELPEMLARRPVPPPAPEGAQAEKPAADPVAETDAKVLEQVKSDEKELVGNLEHLADRIGPRLTGSPKLDEASHWTAEMFRKYGLSNVHLEQRTINTAWTRGTARGRITSPTEQALTLASAGWSPNTKGAVRGNVIGIKAEKEEDLAQYKGKLKGAIVVVGPALDFDEPRNPILTPFGEMAIPIASPRVAGQPFNLAMFIKMWVAEIKFFNNEGVAAVLFPSDKSYGLLNMFSVSRGGEYKTGAFPLAFVTGESHHLLWRLLDSGPVQAEVEISNSASKKPVEVYNTVAEIPGSEKPDEVVIIGGHLDSWDLGTGATDNGTGAMAVLEAAHALQQLGVKPKRTIRFVLFTGEEQGLVGSRAYVEAHKAELGKISGVLVHDSGTGRVLTVGIMANYAARETMDRVVYPLAKIGLLEPSLRVEGGSDHVPFDEAGVPGFWCVQDPADYAQTHHSQADTFDRVRPDDLTEGAQVLAVWAYNVAQLPGLLPRKPAPPAPEKKP
ncbi:MAG TPA: M20/M25/M40 family metallo-hydrolase [Candidatus Acidoferrales bacterium]|nr:M20/M25/M40 family metallo-hydrolase [Candidatus Acidoferrales bacterium]